MARPPGSNRTQKPQGSRKSANASGYAKRKSLKSQALSNASDVYEYQPERVRRSKVKLELEKDELAGAPREDAGGSEDEGDGERRGKSLKPRLVGENDDEGGIREDEDEDIDSDAAFDESDEERFAGFGFSYDKKQSNSNKKHNKTSSGQGAKAVRFAEVDLNEDTDEDVADEPEEDESGASDEEEEEGDPDEFIDVLDILDGRGEPQSEDDLGEVQKQPSVRRQEKSRRPQEETNAGTDIRSGEGESEDEEMDEEEVEDASEDIISVSESEDDADASALQNLETFITSLDAGKKRKVPDDNDAIETPAGQDRKQRRRLLKEQTQTGTESEFAAAAGASKLNLDDLLAPLASSSNLQSLKKSAKVLASSKTQTLAAPLPQRTQDRLDREAAYEQTKEEIDKWSATMKRIKEAEHLSFPLQSESRGRTSNLELMAKFKPTTELESAVDKLLKSAKMREEDLSQTEALKMNHLSVEEVAARRGELAKMRDLMFRNEAKAKRIAKIKSKAYRRIRKKDKAKLAAKLGELDEDDEEDEDGQMKREMDRARERATLRHKNTGKWAKAMKARGELDEDQRRDIGEMLDRGEKLRRRIQGRGSGDESEDADDDESDVEGEDAIQRIKRSAFDELERLQEVSGVDEEIEEKKGKSIFEMKFMKDAMIRDKQRADRMADDFVREMGGQIHGDSDDGSDSHEPSQDAAVERIGGRVSYRPGNAPVLLNTFPSLASDTSSVTLKSTDFPQDGQPESPVTTSPLSTRPVPLPEEVNPWLAPHEGSSSKSTQKKHEVVVSKDSAGAEKSKNKLRKRVQKREEEKEKAKEDATVDVTMSNVMTLGTASSTAGPSSQSKRKEQSAKLNKLKASAGEEEEDPEANSEVDEQEQALERKGKGREKGVRAFEQRDLVALAFAGDNVVQDFAEAKRREIQEDAPKEVDTTLQGWGSWGGAGTKKAPPKSYLIKKIAGINPTTRTDYKKSHVIISEKRDKKAAKYLVKDLPYPYTSKAQFERNMDTPIGSEWNTRVGFQRGTLPKVVKKMGTVITPLEKLL